MSSPTLTAAQREMLWRLLHEFDSRRTGSQFVPWDASIGSYGTVADAFSTALAQLDAQGEVINELREKLSKTDGSEL